MVNKDALERLEREMEMMEAWRDVARQAMADELEVCAVCGRARDREHLVRCGACGDVFVCEEGLCTWLHHARSHPSTPFAV